MKKNTLNRTLTYIHETVLHTALPLSQNLGDGQMRFVFPAHAEESQKVFIKNEEKPIFCGNLQKLINK